MNILYESSVLGIGHTLERAKTGIFRVIENVLLELLQHPDLNINLTSIQGGDIQKHLLAYAEHMKLGQHLIPEQLELVLQERKEAILRRLQEQKHAKYDAREYYRLLKSQIKTSILPKEALFTNKYDIFHSPYHPIPTKITADKSVKKFWTSYDLIPILFPHFFLQETINEVKNALSRLNQDTWVFCISESTKTDLLNYLGNTIDPAKLIVTPLAASNDFYKVEDKNKIINVISKYAVPTDKPYILSLCTLEPRKNIIQTIKAFTNLVQEEKTNDINLVLSGTKGWKFDSIFNEIKNIDAVRNKIFATGYISDNDQAALYSGAQMFVYPSFYEGFGLPPLEAMQCGVPVITSNTSSLPEVVGAAGIMVDPQDLSALTQSMLDLHRNEAKREEYAKKAIERSKLFSWTDTTNLTVNGYKKSLLN